jgi:predicted Zn-dependent peptidase
MQLHKVYTSNISDGVALTCVVTDKFKTGCLSVNLITALDRSTAAATALMPHVLRRGSATLPDMGRISAALDELYGARIEPIVRKKGETQCVGFYADFPDDRYIPGGERVLEKLSTHVGEILISPDMRGGLLRDDYVDGEKKNLIDDIRAGINDKRGYSIDRLLEEMCADEAYGINRLGSEAEAQAVTAQSLTSRYRDIINNSAIKVFYCGSSDPSRVESALRSALRGLPEQRSASIPKTKIVLRPASSPPRRFSDVLDVTQGKLTVGFRLGNAMASPNYPALMVFNAIYGGSVTSKLFLNVREKLSLCYYASSVIDKHKGVMVVASGVEFSNFDSALGEILSQLEQVKSGEVSDWELQSAKRSVITAVKSAMDKPGGLEELYFDSGVAAVSYDPGDLCGMIEAIALDDVVEVASGIQADAVYTMHN